MRDADRFWSKVADHGDCWVWIAARTRGGYGHFYAGSRSDGTRQPVYAHRWAYEFMVAEIPPGLELDHLCRNPACVRPDHLEPVTHAENMRRGVGGIRRGEQQRAKTACPYGHPLDGVKSSGWRYCRTCERARRKAYREAHRDDPEFRRKQATYVATWRERRRATASR